jgi:hypothetical protein
MTPCVYCGCTVEECRQTVGGCCTACRPSDREGAPVTTTAAPPRTERPPCPSCCASAKGCRGVQLLAGRPCCPACRGWHDTEEDH